MDKLEAWRVRGRIATAMKNLRESMTRVTTDSRELSAAIDEAEALGLISEIPTAAGAGATQ
jgi:hypothetical protein